MYNTIINDKNQLLVYEFKLKRKPTNYICSF